MTGLRAYLYCLKQAYLFDDAPVWRALSTPAVILHGTHDSYIPYAHAKRLAEELPAARLIPLEGANHIIVLNNFDDVAQAIAHEAS
jgi:pimeloyl-ACP methyl ester carboxylesterase